MIKEQATQLEYYSNMLNDQLTNTQRLVIQTNLSLTYLNLHNYPQAYRLLEDIEQKLNEIANQKTQHRIISIKINTIFCLIELAANNRDNLHYRLAKIITQLKKYQQKQSIDLCFRVIMKILVGQEDINQLVNQAQLRVTVSDQIMKQPNYIMLSLAIVQQLLGNIQLSYKLSYRFYQQSKNSCHRIFMLIGCKHLEHITKIMNLQENIQTYYKEQLQKIMQLSQFYGIYQQTLFRNYNNKIELGTEILTLLLKTRQQIYQTITIGRDCNDYYLCVGILKKILVMKYKNNRQNQNDSYIANCSYNKHVSNYSHNNISNPTKYNTKNIKQIQKLQQNLIKYKNTNKLPTQLKLILMKNNQLTKNIKQTIMGKLKILSIKLQNIVQRQVKNVWNEMLMLPPRVLSTQRYHHQNINKYQCQIQQSLEFSKKIYYKQQSKQLNHFYWKTHDQQLKQDLQYKIGNQRPHMVSRSVSPRIQKIDLSPYRSKKMQYHHCRKNTHDNTYQPHVLSPFKHKVVDEEQYYHQRQARQYQIFKKPVKKGQIRHNRCKTSQIEQQKQKIRNYSDGSSAQQQQTDKMKVTQNTKKLNKTENLSKYFRKQKDLSMNNTNSQDSKQIAKLQKQKHIESKNISILIKPQKIHQQRLQHSLQHKLVQSKIQPSNNIMYSKVKKVKLPEKKQSLNNNLIIVKKSKDKKITDNNSINESKIDKYLKKQHLAKQQQSSNNLHNYNKLSTHVLSKNKKIPHKIQKLAKICASGQYFIKRHYSSDGGAQKFVKIDGLQIKWAVDQDKMCAGTYQDYKLRDIKGIVYGKVTKNFMKQSNKKLQPWKCFSLILQKRTLDFYCTQQIDPYVWIPGISYNLHQLNNKLQLKSQVIPVSIISPGKVLWKRMFMKLQYLYIRPSKKGKKQTHRNTKAFAIIQFGKQLKAKQFNKITH